MRLPQESSYNEKHYGKIFTRPPLPNTTLKFQPLDQGIIQSFKGEYRKELVQKLIRVIEDEEKHPSINCFGCNEDGRLCLELSQKIL